MYLMDRLTNNYMYNNIQTPKIVQPGQGILTQGARIMFGKCAVL